MNEVNQQKAAFTSKVETREGDRSKSDPLLLPAPVPIKECTRCNKTGPAFDFGFPF
jgi:hypothetical protein